MQSIIDQAITAASSSEGVFTAKSENVESIKTAIQQATSPLQNAENEMDSAAAVYKRDLLSLASVATEAANAIPVDPAPAVTS
jgi:hypothetical protein